MIRTFIFLPFLLLFSVGLNAQDLAKKKIEGSFKNKSLDLALLNLKIKYRLEFVYDEADVKDVHINVYLPKQPLSEAMALLLYDTGLGFTLEEPKACTINYSTSPTAAKPARKKMTVPTIPPPSAQALAADKWR